MGDLLDAYDGTASHKRAARGAVHRFDNRQDVDAKVLAIVTAASSA